MNILNDNSTILYQDKDIKVTPQFIQIKCYYFPIGTSMAKMRLWGMDISNWGYWLPGDCSRCSRQKFIGIHIGKSIKPSFTTEQLNIVYNIIMTEWNKHKNIHTNNYQNQIVIIDNNNNNNQTDTLNRPILRE